jgi:hypothetical protein
MTKDLQHQFQLLAQHYHMEADVTGGAGDRRLFGASALKVNGKIFAMLTSTGQFVVKLNKGRVDELKEDGYGTPFEMGGGRVMKEWLALQGGSLAQWHALADEALALGRRAGQA